MFETITVGADVITLLLQRILQHGVTFEALTLLLNLRVKQRLLRQQQSLLARAQGFVARGGGAVQTVAYLL